MEISIVTSKGEGSTLLSAFDNALQNAGVSNYNLIVLSSIIPPHSTIITKDCYETPVDEFGHRLYIVRAEMRSDTPGEFVGAGIGWYQLEDGRGFFVEHETVGSSEDAVTEKLMSDIENSLKDMCVFRDLQFNKSNLHNALSVAHVKDKPACVLALAIYRSESW